MSLGTDNPYASYDYATNDSWSRGRYWHPVHSSIDLAEYDIERTDDRSDIGQHVPAAEEIHGLEVRNGRRAILHL